MVNPEKGEIPLEIGDKTYVLTLKTAGLAALQRRFSPAGSIIPLDQLMKDIETALKKQSIEHCVAFFCAALQKHHKGITEDQVMDLIDEAGGIPGIALQLEQLGISLAPDKEDVQELVGVADGNPQKARTKKR